jgi:general secretion pathway protein N
MTFDTRHNLLSVMLIGAIALLILIALLSFWLLGRVDVAKIAPDTASAGIIERPVAENPSLSELSEYARIVERPVFFADRSLPVMEVAGVDDEVEESEPLPEVEIPELEATLAGIIITPEVRLAMVTDRSSNETLLLREGMTMSGEKSAWKVASIRPRGVEFETEDGQTEDLELEVETDALKPGARPRPAATRAAAATESDEAAETPADNQSQQEAARARAEEIRRRVAERRAQLRAEAERRAREQDGGG